MLLHACKHCGRGIFEEALHMLFLPRGYAESVGRLEILLQLAGHILQRDAGSRIAGSKPASWFGA